MFWDHKFKIIVLYPLPLSGGFLFNFEKVSFKMIWKIEVISVKLKNKIHKDVLSEYFYPLS